MSTFIGPENFQPDHRMDHSTSSSSNVDAQQIAHFDALATAWWDTQGHLKSLHAINPLRLEYVLRHSHGLFDKQVLDVGCGGGILAESMALEGAKVTGIDKSTELLQVARAHASARQLSIHYLHQSVESLAKNTPHHYDVVTCMELLEHVPDPAAIVQACSQLVKPQGYVFFSTLNRTVKAWLLAIIAAEQLLHLVPKGTHHIQKFIRPSELCHWLATTPLRECHITGLHYHPLWRRFNFDANVDVNYLLVAQHQG